MPLSTISSISMLEIIDSEESRMDKVDENKPVEVDTPSIKQTAEDVPTLKKKLWALLIIQLNGIVPVKERADE